jgi:hypothetical protein
MERRRRRSYSEGVEGGECICLALKGGFFALELYRLTLVV